MLLFYKTEIIAKIKEEKKNTRKHFWDNYFVFAVFSCQITNFHLNNFHDIVFHTELAFE